MKRIITAAALTFATSATAEMAMTDDMLRARDMTAADIYTTATQDGYKWDLEVEMTGLDPEWNRIGEIEDVMFDKEGKIAGVVAEVGGFLDIGDKHVFIGIDEVRMIRNGDADDAELVFVTGATEEQLEEREGIDEGFWE
ncbi:PRC-barrel domain protein [Aliiruegeria haliotis]|uniref:PRC-barrel domain protein n=1 Tax=Aliiruegeria haliotis TaxID=1280846 RepID=A0A2T0RLZ2_9RHOB|nr:PRC-barrel domain-containing protein [Aliiruegeria haliotis]PRY22133.1 PRC-barrel domain protein [Aliiruegeria haliotis]